MNDPMLPLPGLSPASGKPVVKFDGDLLSSDGGVVALREVEQRLRLADRLPRPPPAPERLRHPAAAILGAAGESLGMDRQLRTTTAKRRVHSLFRQGCLLYDLIPNMPQQRLRPLIERYQDLLRQTASFPEL